MHCLKIILGTSLIFLASCAGTNTFGMKTSDFDQLSEKERIIVIENYNEQTKRQRELDAEQAKRQQEHDAEQAKRQQEYDAENSKRKAELAEKEMETRVKTAPFDTVKDSVSALLNYKSGKKHKNKQEQKNEEKLTVSFKSGFNNQELTLSDGQCFKTALGLSNSIDSWQPGHDISVTKTNDHFHPFVIVNHTLGVSVNAKHK